MERVFGDRTLLDAEVGFNPDPTDDAGRGTAGASEVADGRIAGAATAANPSTPAYHVCDFDGSGMSARSTPGIESQVLLYISARPSVSIFTVLHGDVCNSKF